MELGGKSQKLSAKWAFGFRGEGDGGGGKKPGGRSRGGREEGNAFCPSSFFSLCVYAQAAAAEKIDRALGKEEGYVASSSSCSGGEKRDAPASTPTQPKLSSIGKEKFFSLSKGDRDKEIDKKGVRSIAVEVLNTAHEYIATAEPRAIVAKERESEGGRVLSILSLLPRVPNSRPNEGIISNAHADRSIRVGVGE